jgi:hypothetical protein
VSPAWVTATLPKDGEMEPVYFELTPSEEGSLNLYLMIFLAPDFKLLEELHLKVQAVEAIRKVPV